ncbi:MAG: hypothetical protein KJ737_16640 [Proteobacteria bacterium]|nr:hypothetical protein [Pseudomonadota bacterium]
MAYEKLKYGVVNLLDLASLTFEGWTEDPDYPKENLFNKRMSKRGGFAGSRSGSIVIDLGSTQTVNGIALMNHNLTSGATISIAGNSSNSWGSPAFSVTIPYREFDAAIVFDIDQDYRYWRLSVNDSGRADADVKIGELILSNLTTLSRNHDWNLKEQHSYGNIKHETEGGNTWAYTLNNRKSWVMTWTNITGADLSPITTLIRSVHGRAYPFLMILEDAPYFVRAQDDVLFERPVEIADFEALGPDIFPIDYAIHELIFTEETRGINT